MTITLVDQADGAILVRQDLEDGNVRVVFADPYCAMSETLPPEGAQALLSEGEPLKLLQLAASSDASELAKIERGIVELSADNATDRDGYLDSEKVARYARERNLGYNEAREQLRAALVGDDSALGAKTVERVAGELGLSYADAATALSEAGYDGLDGERQSVPVEDNEHGFTAAEALALSQEEGISYADAAQILAERRGR